jgi:hypothetical protein
MHPYNVVCMQEPGTQSAWVISGGVGALGSLMAAWLAQYGCRNLTLLGRLGKLQGQDMVLVQRIVTGHQLVCVARYSRFTYSYHRAALSGHC